MISINVSNASAICCISFNVSCFCSAGCLSYVPYKLAFVMQPKLLGPSLYHVNMVFGLFNHLPSIFFAIKIRKICHFLNPWPTLCFYVICEWSPTKTEQQNGAKIVLKSLYKYILIPFFSIIFWTFNLSIAMIFIGKTSHEIVDLWKFWSNFKMTGLSG